MMFIHFLEDNSVIVGLIVLATLITVVPACAAIYRYYHLASENELDNTPHESPFLGVQLDMAMLILGIILLLGLASWAWEVFF